MRRIFLERVGAILPGIFSVCAREAREEAVEGMILLNKEDNILDERTRLGMKRVWRIERA